jgi:hypothetical protein
MNRFWTGGGVDDIDTQLQAVRQARKQIELVRRLLLNPTPASVDACNAPLCEAIESLERLEGYLRQGDHPKPAGARLKSEVFCLRREVGIVSVLLKSAGAFYEGFGNMLGLGPQPEEVDYGHGRAAPPERRLIVIHG